jgi:DNA modification methylase
MPRNIDRRYVQDTEFAIWAVKKGAKWVFNKPKDAPYLRAQFTAPVVAGKERIGHPTQKSLAVMEQIIRIHTNENDTVLDPFMGSGTTGVAALKNNRRFIGIELNDVFFDLSTDRLAHFNAK